mmetsp:Transcript_4973/g.18083  ORF Transcript_4973/g.18083 Transcript_4973/m.18083 type:complete len:278 (+) Transcript_4973:1570-2403(+)
MLAPAPRSAPAGRPPVRLLPLAASASPLPCCWRGACWNTPPPDSVRPWPCSAAARSGRLCSRACRVAAWAAWKETWACEPSSTICTATGPMSAGLSCSSACCTPSTVIRLTRVASSGPKARLWSGAATSVEPVVAGPLADSGWPDAACRLVAKLGSAASAPAAHGVIAVRASWVARARPNISAAAWPAPAPRWPARSAAPAVSAPGLVRWPASLRCRPPRAASALSVVAASAPSASASAGAVRARFSRAACAADAASIRAGLTSPFAVAVRPARAPN